MNQDKPKVLLYCQHLLGVGHLTRSLALAEGLKNDFTVKFVQGGPSLPRKISPEISLIELPPLLMKEDTNELYDPFEKKNVREIFEDRKKMLNNFFAKEQFAVILIELFPFGRKKFKEEILSLIQMVRGANPKTKIYCSLRDILVEKPNFLERDKKIAALVNEYFDGVFVHSDPLLIPLDATFSQMDLIREKIIYTGFVCENSQKNKKNQDGKLARENKILVSQGGGVVGIELLESMVDIACEEEFKNYFFTFVTGPNIPVQDKYRLEDKIKKIAEENMAKNIEIKDFLQNFEEELSRVKLSISLAGYNTIMNILNTRTPALVYPYNANQEQRIRAERLAQKGFLGIINPSDITKENRKILLDKISNYLQSQLPNSTIHLNGVAKTKEFLQRKLAEV